MNSALFSVCGGAPVSTTVKGVKTGIWILENGFAGEVPESPVRAEGQLVELVLIPYGCTNLRITEFPTIK